MSAPKDDELMVELMVAKEHGGSGKLLLPPQGLHAEGLTVCYYLPKDCSPVTSPFATTCPRTVCRGLDCLLLPAQGLCCAACDGLCGAHCQLLRGRPSSSCTGRSWSTLPTSAWPALF